MIKSNNISKVNSTRKAPPSDVPDYFDIYSTENILKQQQIRV
ncbi:MAG: hypothetical protein ACK521_05375 [bacterium]